MSDASLKSDDQAWYEAVTCIKKLNESLGGKVTSRLCVDSAGKVTRKLVLELDVEV